MNTVKLIQFSLNTAFDILGQVTADLTQEQADWMPPGIANPIGGLYWHTIASTDMIIHEWSMGQKPLSHSDGWQEKVLVESGSEESKDHPPEIRDTRVDLPALHEYAKVISKTAQKWLASLTPEDLERKIDTPVGELNLAQLLESFVVWHINVRCGEIAAMKGCQGAKGYPF